MVEPITTVRHGNGKHGGTVEVRGSTIAVLGNAKLSQAWLRLQGDLLDDLGLGLGISKAVVSLTTCMAAQRREHGGEVHAVLVGWRSVTGLHLRSRH